MFVLTITKKTGADEVILGSRAVRFSTITSLVSLIIIATNEYPCSKYKNKIKLLWVSASLLKRVHLFEWTHSELTATLKKRFPKLLTVKNLNLKAAKRSSLNFFSNIRRI